MIVGNGMIARAFAGSVERHDNFCIYAAGVSRSTCTDEKEFIRERDCLSSALELGIDLKPFVYFSTCSINDPDTRDTPYVRHKMAMEAIVRSHPEYLVLRLPQVAGSSSNPHTLLNFLYAHIKRAERFVLWTKANRNIIDICDIILITQQLIADLSIRRVTLNVANSKNYPIPQIVEIFERIVGRQAIFDELDKGTDYEIDIDQILPVIQQAGVSFDEDYLERVLRKYYLVNS